MEASCQVWFNLAKQFQTRIAKLGRKHLCKVLYAFLRFIPFGQQIWLPRAILVSDWLLLKKSRIALGSHICWSNGTK
jgi:hypothetical protein